MTGSAQKLTLYERLGGETLERTVYLFYDKVMTDPRLKPFFKGIDTKVLARHQYEFLMRATGGPADYDGPSLRDTHRRLVIEKGLNDSHFDAIIENLKKALEEIGVGYSTVEEVIAAVESLRNEVLNR